MTCALNFCFLNFMFLNVLLHFEVVTELFDLFVDLIYFIYMMLTFDLQLFYGSN